MNSQIIYGADPDNMAPDARHLVEHYLTPIDQFFVRNHAPVPHLNADTFMVAVEGATSLSAYFAVADLSRFLPTHTVIATMACAGNRRQELNAVRPIASSELVWGGTTLGTAAWTGTALRDLLSYLGVTARRGWHVAFEGADSELLPGGGTRPFGASIPLEVALSGDALLATAMNGAPLTPDHGFPLRAFIPGAIGARSVKWLSRIIIQEAPSSNHYQANAYRLRRPGQTDAPMLHEQPLYAFICEPGGGDAGRRAVRGYAVPHGLNAIETVEVSLDGGATWHSATVTTPCLPGTWVLWHFDADLPAGDAELVARARDSSGAEQPASLDAVWNEKGYVNNAYHHLRITLR